MPISKTARPLPAVEVCRIPGNRYVGIARIDGCAHISVPMNTRAAAESWAKEQHKGAK